MQQTKETRTKLNPNEELVRYIRGPPKEVYTIALDKKKTNELLTFEKIFSEDSTNITNLNEVQYVVKFSGNPLKTAFIMSDFLDLKYENLQELPRVLILQT